MDSYVYRKLGQDEIRILILSPSTTDRVECALETVLLSDELSFDALSYRWGSTDNLKSVQCEGGTLNITQNLFSALRHLAYSHQERRLWVDAICINQGDREEKSIQIRRMGKIYTNARQTIVWLGADIGRENAIRHVEIAATQESCLDTVATLTSIAPIFEAEWFKRLWVVQEFALAKQVTMVAGRNSVPVRALMEVLTKFPEIWNHQDLFSARAVSNLLNMQGLHNSVLHNRRHGEPPYILELFRETEWFEMSVPNDRIYALYGLTGDIGFPVNVESGYDTRVFVDFAIWALKEFPGLALLSYTRGAGGRCQCGGPSWAPCNDMEELPISLLNVSHFNACGRLSEYEYNIYPSFELRIKGAIIDTIQSVCEGWFNAADSDVQSKILRNGATFAKCEVGESYTKYCAALLFELNAKNERASQSLINLVGDRINDGTSEKFWEVTHVLTKWPRFRCFCTTFGRRLAWAPKRDHSSTLSEDKICIFKGSRVPYVIRRQTDGSYTLIGECWVQGLMDGEAVEADEFELEELVLR